MDLTPVTSRSGDRFAMPSKVAPFLKRFAREEDGVIVAFSVYFMLMILFVGAVGVDVMRYESQRSRLQHVLDQAVLAAADLDQRSPPAEVVADYFAKSGLTNAELLTTVVNEGLNFREVSATAREVVPTQISHMLGINQMMAPAASAAEERVDSVEISMVLDVSGSMNGSRLNNLRPAARDFVDTVLALSDAEDVSISIVPYATQVAAGEELLNQFRTHDSHDYSSCINFDDNDFDTTAMSPLANGSQSYQQTAHFDKFTYSVDTSSEGLRDTQGSLPVCSNRPSSEILPLSNNVNALHGQINALAANGNTSADLGIKWGAALLDPSLQPVVNNLIASNTVDNAFAGRPLDYTDPNSIKVLVVMTDGQNTNQYMLRDPYRSGNSNVYYNAGTNRFAVRYNNRYYEQSWSGNSQIRSNNWSWSLGGGYSRLSNQDLFAKVSQAWIAYYIYGGIDGNAWNTWYNGPDTSVSGWTKDSRMQDICSAAKNQGIVIYTIGFQAPTHGSDELRQCASSPSHFFDVAGLDIGEAFSAIAQSISQLKLIQ
ncbi:pilus assembly protein TadG-related protein [Lentibacter sp.]|uniref:pilus assembly protein TadG-related protein n=1 Tax=Lentibacter sp. TaxID=2024994 RepID=UPI003F6B4ED7